MADKKKGGLIKSFTDPAKKWVIDPVKKHPRKIATGAGLLIGIPGYETFLIAETIVGAGIGWVVGDRADKGAKWAAKKNPLKKKK